MRPPEDASLPWAVGVTDPSVIRAADGSCVGVINRPELAAYAVAAVNATPGLVEALRSIAEFEPRPDPMHNPYDQIAYHARTTAREALAALPKEAGGS